MSMGLVPAGFDRRARFHLLANVRGRVEDPKNLGSRNSSLAILCLSATERV